MYNFNMKNVEDKISRSQKRLKVNRDAYPGVIPRRTFSIGSPGVPVAPVPPVSFQPAEMLPMTPIFIPPAPSSPPTFFHPSRFPATVLRCSSHERIVDSSPDRSGSYLPPSSRLSSVKPMSPLRRRRVASCLVSSRVVSSRLVSSPLVSSRLLSSPPLRLLQQSWLSSTGALDSRKNNYTERGDWYGLRIFARGFPSVRRPL